MLGSTHRTILTLGLVALAAALLALVAALLLRGDGNAPIQILAPTPQSESAATGDSAPPQPTELRVYITGAVRTPGVYPLPPGSRLKDGLDAAGGSAADAALESVNLAQRVQDGEHYHIPRRGETPPPTVSPSGSGPSAAGSAPASNGLIDLNTASPEALDTLPGVGPTRARAIVEYRQQHGRFQSAEEITNVSGIGPAIYQDIKHLVTVGAAP